MTLEEAFSLINNLDYPEGLRRKFAPGYSLIQVNREGEVVRVERFKETPMEPEQVAALDREPGTIQLNGSPGMYSSVSELANRISRSMWLFEHMRK